MLNILEICKGAKLIGISGHERPDGDCIGSSMAIYYYLKEHMPEAEIYVYLEESARKFYHLRDIDKICVSAEKKGVFDVFFALDTAPDRLSHAKELYENAKIKVNIDHHITNPGVGDFHLVKPEIGSCAEIIYELIPESHLNKDIAKAIYIGIIHDTGVFQYSNTKSSTLEAAAKLISYDFEFHNLISESFYGQSFVEMKLSAFAVNKSKLLLEGKVIFSYITLEEMKEYQADSSDLGGVVSQLKNVLSIKCAIFIYELENGLWKVSLRTNDEVDAAKIAVALGGGGHIRAAGASVKGNIDEILEKTLEEIQKQI